MGGLQPLPLRQGDQPHGVPGVQQVRRGGCRGGSRRWGLGRVEVWEQGSEQVRRGGLSFPLQARRGPQLPLERVSPISLLRTVEVPTVLYLQVEANPLGSVGSRGKLLIFE